MLEHIFLSILSASLTTSFIIIFLMILSPFINRRYAAKWKYWVWILLALRLMIPFNMSDMQDVLENLSRSLTAGAIQYESDDCRADTTATARLLVQTPQIQTPRKVMLEIPSQMTEPLPSSKQIRVTSKVTILMIVEIIWLTGGILFISIHLCSYLIYRRKISQSGHRIINDSIYGLCDKLFNELQLDRRIPIISYDRADSPMVLGIIHPILVLPAEEYADEELYYILKHEFIHYKRHDVCFKLLFVLANAVHWFNPVIWLMQREAVVDMELACDERVMLDADYTARKTYAEILFSILHNKCRNTIPLSTQFYGGKQLMKKRFRNILVRSGKRNGLYILVCTLGLVIGLGFQVGCSVSASDRLTKTLGKEGALEGIVADSVDVPDIVLERAKELVAEWFVWARTDFPDYGYANWRIELLTHCYTYEDFEGITLQIYQLNYELLSEQPQNVILTGGMSITEDGWVTPDYSNSRFLIFLQNGDNLSYLTYLFENDCYPPDEVFTDDLDHQLEAAGVLASDTTTLTYIMEGDPVEQVATLFTGSGYSIYIPDNDWISCGSDIWQSDLDDRIRFWITCFADQDMSQVKRELFFSQGMRPDEEAAGENELTGRKGDIITRARLIEQPEASCVWAVFYCYPEEAIEGAGARLPMIVDTFSAAEAVKYGLWDMIPYSGETDTNVLQFTNGLQLILPEAWNDKIVLEEFDSTHTLVISEKNNAKADGGGYLVNLFYVSRNGNDLTFSADNPFEIMGENAQKIFKVLGVYRREDNEYALIYTRYPYDDYANEDPELRKDFEDLYRYVDDVQVITDNIPGFTECGLEDLDWVWME